MKKVTLNEKDLINLIKKIIHEQTNSDGEFVMSDVPLFYEYNVDDMRTLLTSTDIKELETIVRKIANARPNESIESLSNKYKFKPTEDFLYFYPNYIELLKKHFMDSFERGSEDEKVAIKIYNFLFNNKKRGDKKGQFLSDALKMFNSFSNVMN